MLSIREVMFFNYKRADFWLPNFGFKRSLLSLPNIFLIVRQLSTKNKLKELKKPTNFFMIRKMLRLVYNKMNRYLETEQTQSQI